MNCGKCTENSVFVSSKIGGLPVLKTLDSIDYSDVRSRSVLLSCPNCSSALEEESNNADATTFKCPSCHNTRFRIEKQKTNTFVFNGAAAFGTNAKAVGAGGTLIEGDVHGDINIIGDFVGRDKITYTNTPSQTIQNNAETMLVFAMDGQTFTDEVKTRNLASKIAKLAGSDDPDFQSALYLYLKRNRPSSLAALLDTVSKNKMALIAAQIIAYNEE